MGQIYPFQCPFRYDWGQRRGELFIGQFYGLGQFGNLFFDLTQGDEGTPKDRLYMR